MVTVPAGFLFFSGRASHEAVSPDQWAVAWAGLAFITAVSLTFTPFLAIVEGSGRVTEVALVRLIQGVVGSLFCWLVLWSGGGLWAAMMTPAFGVIVMSLWLKRRFPALSITRFDRDRPAIHWRTDIWPQQWRFGLGWTASYLLTQIYTPILFYFSGTVVAGQMGLSFSIANLLAVVSHVWITRHVPAMTQAAAGKDWNTLDRLFMCDFKHSLVFFLSGSIVLCMAHQLLQGSAYGERVLPFWPFAGLLCISLINHVTGSLAAQLRVFQREPLVRIVVPGAVVIVPLALWAAPSYAPLASSPPFCRYKRDSCCRPSSLSGPVARRPFGVKPPPMSPIYEKQSEAWRGPFPGVPDAHGACGLRGNCGAVQIGIRSHQNDPCRRAHGSGPHGCMCRIHRSLSRAFLHIPA